MAKARRQTILKEPGQTATNIKIEGDGDLKHQFLMQAYDACKQAGYHNVSFVAPARERPMVK
ncbi:MAG: biopolymer transporter ExbD [Planctomycetes bacterium]|nr:biopolymer transporter ExbD [Planctomycetota bacterium]